MGLRFVLCALLLVSCSNTGDDGDSNQAGSAGKGSKPSNPTPAEPTRKLMLSTTVAHLEFGVRLQLRGHLLDADSEAVADTLVSFALVGHPEDSSIDTLDARTDARGTFENALTAGQRTSTFLVRVSAEDTADALIDVSVSDAGFGSLRVGAEYHGAREVAQRSVYAQAGRSCDDDDGNARRDGDPIATLSEGQKQALMPALPAGVDYAVTALAQSESGMLVARGCVDGVEVDTDSETPIEIEFTDEPLARAGEFTLQAELDASGPASVFNTVLSSAALVQIDGDVLGAPPPVDAEGVFLLDQLDAALRSKGAQPGWVDLADAIEADRNTVPAEGEPTTDHTLQAQLGFEEKGPRAAIPYLAQLVQDNLAQMRLTAALSLLPSGDEAATLRPLRIEALPSLGDAAPVSIDLTAIDIAATSSAAFLPESDALHVSRLRFRGQLGALAIQVLRRTLHAQDDGGALESIREELGCAVLSAWLGARDDAGACKASCIVAACDRALTTLRGAAESALRAIDKARPNVAFSGEFALHDDNGDLMAETLKCDEFDGEWQAEKKGTADVIVGKASAAALAPVQ